MPEYCASTLAERLIPASDVSNQMLDRRIRSERNKQHEVHDERRFDGRHSRHDPDGREAGDFFLFGLTATEVAGKPPGTVRGTGTMSMSRRPARLGPDKFRPFQPQRTGRIHPLLDTLLTGGDYYAPAWRTSAYLEADKRLVELYADPDAWAGKAILNVAGSGKFSSDHFADRRVRRTCWNVEPCPVP